jgi:RNA polymerase sigma factor (sigma-70 family)
LLRNEYDAEDAFQATFLVLVRKARSVRPSELVGHWLYGVAYRTAVRARTLDARRRDKERAMPLPAAPPKDGWQDVWPLLDRELNGLPERYRIPVVLCDLEGKSRKEVAGALGCPEGTLSSRLNRARALLAQRLSRRGVTLSGGALAALVAADGAVASVPFPLLVSTTKAAMVLASGQATAACVLLKAAELAQGVGNTMFFAKFKTTVLLGACAALALGAGGFAYRAQAGKGKPAELGQGQGQPAPQADRREEGNRRVAQPDDGPQQAGTDLPDAVGKSIREFEAEAEAIQRKADAEIQAAREKLLAGLQAQLEKYTKAGKLDEAVAIRDRIKPIQAASERTRLQLAAARERAQNLLVNGSFEEGPETALDGVHCVGLDAGSKAMRGWEVTKGIVAISDFTYWQPAHGKRSLGLTRGPDGASLRQSFKTRKGNKYRVTFSLGGDPHGGPVEMKLRVRAAGKSAEFAFDKTGKNRVEMGWVRKTWEFTADADETALEFTSMTEGIFGVALDDIVVVAVKE